MSFLDCFANVLNASWCTPLSLLLGAIMGISGSCVPLQCPSVFTASFGGMQLRSSRGSLHNRFLTCRSSHSPESYRVYFAAAAIRDQSAICIRATSVYL